MLRFKEVQVANSVDDLETSQSIQDESVPNCEALDARIASTLVRITQNSNFKVYLFEQKAQKEDRLLREQSDRVYELANTSG